MLLFNIALELPRGSTLIGRYLKSNTKPYNMPHAVKVF